MNISKLTLLSAVFFLTACASTTGSKSPKHILPSNVKSGYQLGNVGITAYNPIPWHTVSESYKPNFKVSSANDVIGEVAPSVGEDLFNTSRSNSFNVGVGYQGRTLDNLYELDKTRTTTDGETEEKINDRTRRSVSKKTPEVPELSPADIQRTLDRMKFGENSNSLDPVTKYRAATALYQRIQTLNNYLDVPYNTRSKHAFLVRSTITVSPFKRNHNYDLYSTLTLNRPDWVKSRNKQALRERKKKERKNLRKKNMADSIATIGKSSLKDEEPDFEELKTGLVTKLKVIAADVYEEAIKANLFRKDGFRIATQSAQSNLTKLISEVTQSEVSSLNDYNKLQKSALASATKLKQEASETLNDFGSGENIETKTIKSICGSKIRRGKPQFKIFPLLVGDSIEKVETTRLQEAINSIGFSFGASGGQVAAGAAFSSALEQIEGLVGDKINSLVTFSQSREDNLTIKLAAAFDPDERYALRDRTFDIAFVLAIDQCEFVTNDRDIEPLELQLVLDNQYRSVNSGNALPSLVPFDLKDLRRRLIADRKLSQCGTNESAKDSVRNFIYYSSNKLGCWVSDRSLYWDLVRARQWREMEGPTITLESLVFKEPEDQFAIYSDDKSTLKTSLVSKHPFDLNQVSGILLKGSTVLARAESTAVSGDKIVFTFPSLRSLEGSPKATHLSVTGPYGGGGKFMLKQDKLKSKISELAESFSLKKLSDQMAISDDPKIGARGLVIVTPKNGKTLDSSIKKLKLSMEGAELDGVLLVDKSGKESEIKGLEMNKPDNSVVFDVQSEFAYRVRTKDNDPKSDVKIVVLGIDDKDEKVENQKGDVVFTAPNKPKKE